MKVRTFSRYLCARHGREKVPGAQREYAAKATCCSILFFIFEQPIIPGPGLCDCLESRLTGHRSELLPVDVTLEMHIHVVLFELSLFLYGKAQAAEQSAGCHILYCDFCGNRPGANRSEPFD